MLVADYLEKLGDKNIPLAIYDNILLTDPSNDIVQIKKFWILYNEKKYDEAAKHFEHTETSEKRGFTSIAIRAYQTWLVLDPSNKEYKQKLDTLIDQIK